jgi:hypothetical protein
MPLFNVLELQSIGAYMLKQGSIPLELIQEYSLETIQKRFNQLGGIMRHVLPASAEDLEQYIEEQNNAIQLCDAISC